MKELRRLWPHALLLLVASVIAYVKSKPVSSEDAPPAPGEVDLWRGKAEDVTKVVFEDKRQKVTLERQKDDKGVWYRGSIEPLAGADDDKKDDKDAGARKHPHTPKPAKVEPATFVSVTVAEKLVDKLAPMRATRAVGVIEDDRLEEFGFTEPHGTLRVTVGGAEHVLLVGSSTAGSGNRYVRDVNTKQVYVVDGTAARDMKGGAARLSERGQHGWKMADVERATIIVGDKRREVIRSGTTGRRFWAEPNTPDKNEETVGNWLGKVERLRPIEYLDSMPKVAEKILRVEYSTAKGALGFLELYRNPGGKDGKDEYVVMTEQLRIPATVTRSIGEQVKDDVGSVVLGSAPADEDKKDGDKKDGDKKDATDAGKKPEGKGADPKKPEGKAKDPKKPEGKGAPPPKPPGH